MVGDEKGSLQRHGQPGETRLPVSRERNREAKPRAEQKPGKSSGIAEFVDLTIVQYGRRLSRDEEQKIVETTGKDD
jgi:hypothetical protein